jgi:RimJ/RimL family protein N-acetyltransferase
MPTSAMFDLQPRLMGTLMELRPLAADDFAALHRAASDPLIWELHPEPDRWKEEVFRLYFDGGLASGGALVVIDRMNGRIIGSSRYAHLKPDEGEVEIGWTFLERAYWGGAWNRELKALMIAHAFRFVERVVFRVGAANLRSRRALEKIGAHLAGTAEHPDRHGTAHPYVVYAIERGRHPAHPGPSSG